MGSIATAIAKRFAERTARESGSRPDMRLSDFRTINDGSAFKIAISYDKNLPQPSAKEVRAFVTKATSGKVNAKMETARAHTEGRHHGITLIVTPQRFTRKIEAAKGMKTVIANTMYLDTTMNETWKVQNENGKKFLECVRHENVEQLLSLATASATRVTAGLSLSDAAVAGATLPEKGDVVKFFDGSAQRVGTVTKIKGDEAYIAEDDGNTFVRPFASIIAIVKKNVKSEQEALNESAAFYANIFGSKDFAREMFPGAKI